MEMTMPSKIWTRSIIAALLLMLSPLTMAQGVSISVNIAPPELPVYDQPPIPGDGYLWTPGYWAWDDDNQDYYWVPGTWVEVPQPDYLWTPGYWAAADGVYLWHAGYWGPTVGFYGGVNYGYGYGGRGYEGGYWQGGHLFYNRAVVNVNNVHITNVYNKTVINNVTTTRVSYNGGNGGVRAQPTATELAAARDRHIQVTSTQRQHEQAARTNPQLRAAANHGNPPIAATPRAGNFSNPVPAKHAEAMSTERGNPQQRLSTPRQGQEAAPNRPTAPNRVAPPERTNTQERAVQPRQPPPVQQRQPPPVEQHQPPPVQQRQPPPVEQRRQPEQTQQARPAPPRPEPRPAPRPAEHPAEHKDDHEHH
jgi:hypothetical protein